MSSKELKPWDRRPWPTEGDKTFEILFASVGRALSRWETYDGYLAVMFSVMVCPTLETRGAIRAYSAVRTFEGRLDMLRAASEAYFDKYPNADFVEQFKDILRHAHCFAPRRNDITHAAVNVFKTPDGEDGAGFALYPPYASFKERSLDNKPSYCMSVKEIEYFSKIFLDLQEPVQTLTTGLVKAYVRSSPHKPKPRALASASPSADQKD